MKYFPFFLDLSKFPILVIGGGAIALQKVRVLVGTQLKLTLVAPKIETELHDILVKHDANIVQRKFQDRDLEGVRIVIIAVEDEQLNQQVLSLAQEKNILCNVVDNTELCEFIFAATIQRDPVTIAVSSSGASPHFAKIIKNKLEILLPQQLGDFVHRIHFYREKLKTKIQGYNQRRFFWEHVLEKVYQSFVWHHDTEKIQDDLDSLIQESEKKHQVKNPHSKKVYLLGAGAGDVDLLTLKALRILQQADYVLYDRLVSKEVLKLVRSAARLIYVGKAKGKQAMSQEQICNLLITLASKKNKVVRLKGGDPFIFGRGGEEMNALLESKIECEIIPGITSSIAGAAYAGIPLTHRDCSHSVKMITLHDLEHKIDWKQYIQDKQTLVIYMGTSLLSQTCQQLIKHGLRSDMLFAIIENATNKNQRILVDQIQNHQKLIEQFKPVSPSIIIIGDVVDYRNKTISVLSTTIEHQNMKTNKQYAEIA